MKEKTFTGYDCPSELTYDIDDWVRDYSFRSNIKPKAIHVGIVYEDNVACCPACGRPSNEPPDYGIRKCTWDYCSVETFIGGEA